MDVQMFCIRCKRCAKSVKFASAIAYTSARCITSWQNLRLYVASQTSTFCCLTSAPRSSFLYRPSTMSPEYYMDVSVSNLSGNSLRGVALDHTLCDSWAEASRERFEQTASMLWDCITVHLNEMVDEDHRRTMNYVRCRFRTVQKGSNR